MKFDHEVVQRNYQMAVEYVKNHYPDVSLVDSNGRVWKRVDYFDAVTQMEYEIKGGNLFFTVKNGNLLLGRNTSGDDYGNPVINVIEHPSDVDIITFLGDGWYSMKCSCEKLMQRYDFAINFDPDQDGIY